MKRISMRQQKQNKIDMDRIRLRIAIAQQELENAQAKLHNLHKEERLILSQQ